MRLIDGHDTYASHLNSIPLGLEYMHLMGPDPSFAPPGWTNFAPPLTHIAIISYQAKSWDKRRRVVAKSLTLQR